MDVSNDHVLSVNTNQKLLLMMHSDNTGLSLFNFPFQIKHISEGWGVCGGGGGGAGDTFDLFVSMLFNTVVNDSKLNSDTSPPS